MFKKATKVLLYFICHETEPESTLQPKLTVNENNVAATLPNELLYLIFSHLPYDPLYDDWPRWPLSSPAHALPLVCRHWRYPATSSLYAAVELRTIAQVRSFYRTILQFPHLAPLVKTLFLPIHPRKPCPASVVDECDRLMRLLPCLDETSYQLDSHRINFPNTAGADNQNKNALVRYLGLAACTAQVGPGFPDISREFGGLRCLLLSGFRIRQRVDPAVTPPLLQLEEITIVGDDSFPYLDDWLCGSPRLRTLCVASIWDQQPSPPVRVLRTKRIHYIAIAGCYTDHSYHLSWLGISDALRILNVSADVFHSTYPQFPTELAEMKIWVVKGIPLNTDMFIQYLEGGPRIGRLILEVDVHLESFSNAKEKIIEVCKRKEIPLCIDVGQCDCEAEIKPEEPPEIPKGKVSQLWLQTLAAAKHIVGKQKDPVVSDEERAILEWETDQQLPASL
ncbi:hypothetical protein PIIN_04703 [Serendipita indica DSM 11827]|uniref:Uncharacterized protein n=1 Tax=Serendipita indica (strain DSM 11827) TaxID=1109443 RepID=G4THH5_SERID|nr:hypothetical protein PIIN_04703 [Serendipita indica DSM 11827]